MPDVNLKFSGPGVTVRTIRIKNKDTGARQTVVLDGDGKGSFSATVGVPYLITRYVVGPIDAAYKIQLSVSEHFKIEGNNPLKGSVWPQGFALHNGRIEVTPK